MQRCGSPDLHKKSFRIKHEDDKFLARLLSKESSKSNLSFRVYYGDVPSAVPFIWETRPGTPKHTFCDDNSNVPPLTPPPSYYSNNINNCGSKKHLRSKLPFRSLLRRKNPNKDHLTSSFPSSSSFSSLSWSSSARSSFSDPMIGPTHVHRRRRFSSCGSSFDERAMDYHRDEMCTSRFGKDKGERVQRGFSISIVKKALLSMVVRGST